MNPDIEFPLADCSAIILAGGRSRRMNADKRDLEIGGIPLLDRAISNLTGKFGEILLSVSGDIRDPGKGVRIVRDAPEGHGPLSGIYSGLMESETENNFVIAADIPEISAELILEMYRFVQNYDIVFPRQPDGKTEPLYGFYKKSILPVIGRNLHKGVNKVVEIYKDVRHKSIPMTDSGWLFNINTEEDLHSYRRRLKI